MLNLSIITLSYFSDFFSNPAMALSIAAGPVKAAPTQPVKNIVLVHGAFADGSSWAKVITMLQAKGYIAPNVGR